MAQRVSSPRRVAVERLGELDGVLFAALGRIGARRFDGHGLSGAGESGAAVIGVCVDALQLEWRQKIGRSIEVRQDEGIIFPRPFKIAQPGEAIGRQDKDEGERQEKEQTAEDKRHLRFP